MRVSDAVYDGHAAFAEETLDPVAVHIDAVVERWPYHDITMAAPSPVPIAAVPAIIEPTK